MNTESTPARLRILHLEDNARDAVLIREMLAADGIEGEVTRVAGREAFERAFAEGSFDVVLSDFNLVGYDGISALRLIRERDPSLPVIMISGEISEAEAVDCLKAGATDYVLKQRLKRLAPAVRRALNEAREQRKLARTQEELAESEKRFRLLAENSTEVFWFNEIHPQRKRTYVSPSLEALCGVSAQRFYDDPETWANCIHPDDRERVKSAYETWLAGRARRFEEEYRFVRPDGEIRWVLDSGVLIHDASGRVVQSCGIARDITERRRTEAALRAISVELANRSGQPFFESLVLKVAELLGTEWAFVSRLLPATPGHARTLAFASRGEIANPIEYDVAGTPCEEALERGHFVLAREVQARFPEDAMLAELGAQSYAGVTLYDARAKPLGHLVAMGRSAFEHPAVVEALLRLFAVSAAAEIERLRSAQRFQDLFQFAPDAMVMVDAEGRIELVNGQVETMLGYSSRELVGQSVEVLVPERARGRHSNLRARFRENGVAQMASGRPDLVVLARDGREIPVEISLAPLDSDRGPAVVAAMRDISERRALEEQLRALNASLEQQVRDRTAALADAERLLRDVTNGVPGAVYQFRWPRGARPRFTFMSPGVHELTGLDRELALRDASAVLGTIASSDREGLLHALRGASTENSDTWVHEFRVRRPDGALRWVRAESRRSGAGDDEAWNGYCVDVTDYRDLEQGLLAAKEAADGANRSKSTFLATMSHEIRTPLNAITGMIELLEHSPVDDEQRGMLKAVRNSSHWLLRIINDILDLSKIEAGRLDIALEPTSLAQLLKSVRDVFSDAASRKGLELRVAVDQSLPAGAICDPLRLRQVLFNLLGNAIKFTAQGRVTLAASAEGRVDDRAVLVIAVSDTGIGIPLESARKLFEPFVQAEMDTTRRFGGTGLGLAVSRRLMELMGGSLVLESEPGRGTTITMRLPVDVVAAERLPLRPAQAEGYRATPFPIPESAAGGARPRLLVADDNAINREVLLRQLRILGYEADAAADGREAVEMAKSGVYGLAILDCHMPEMDGYDAARQIRQLEAADPGHPRMPILACTADAMREHHGRCFEAGMDDIVVKPLDLATLHANLAAWLGAAAPPPAEDAAVPATAPRNGGPINWDRLKAITGGDTEFMRSILQEFALRKAAEAAELHEQLATASGAALRSRAHRLKGAAATAGGDTYAGVCAQIEQAAVAGDRVRLVELRGDAEREFARLCAAIRVLEH